MNTNLKQRLLIVVAALLLSPLVHAQPYKVGDRHPEGGFVIEVDKTGKKGVVIEEEDRVLALTEIEAVVKAKGPVWRLPDRDHLERANAYLFSGRIGNFKPVRYLGARQKTNNTQVLLVYSFATARGWDLTPRDYESNPKVSMRLIQAFDDSSKVASVFPLSRVTGFEQGRKYPSPSGQHYLIFQTDGNLVVYTRQGTAVWALNALAPNWQKSALAVFQPDGNLATYQADKTFVWSARNVPSPAGTTLTLNDKGELQIVGPDGKVLWSSTLH